MPKKVKPLNDKQVNSAKPKEKEYNLSDGDGLSLRIKPNGSKIWIFNYYRPFTRKRANLGFGIYPEVTLAKAREKRLEARQLLIDDIDPQEQKLEKIASEKERLLNSFEAVALSWFEIKKTKIKEQTAKDLLSLLKTYVFPKLGKKAISSLTAPMVINVIRPVEEEGKHETVKRLCQRINNVMVYALNTGIIKHNPLSGITAAFVAPKVQNLPTITPAELPKLMNDINYASIKVTTRILIEWQLHTMTRAGEACGARWDEIDFDKEVWVIPAERMKMKREHTVPLSDYAFTLLERIKPISGNREHIFPSNNSPKKHANASTVNMALKRMGYGGRLVAHGFRSLASTILNEHGFDPDVIEAALAHVDGNEVRRAYNRADYLERRRVMMCWWSEYLTNKGKLSYLKVERIINE